VLALAWTPVAPAAEAAEAPARPTIYENPAQILKTFPSSIKAIAAGVRLRLATGRWIEVIDRPLVKDPSVPCLYAPSLHLAALCETDGDTTVTVLIDLLSGHKVIAPGRPSLLADDTLVAIGPTGTFVADSLTLIRITPSGLIDEGGALFDENFGPGGWADADCYRLKTRKAGADAWLEKTSTGWSQVKAAQSKVCATRHGG
jgi:hypothetical protein